MQLSVFPCRWLVGLFGSLALQEEKQGWRGSKRAGKLTGFESTERQTRQLTQRVWSSFAWLHEWNDNESLEDEPMWALNNPRLLGLCCAQIAYRTLILTVRPNPSVPISRYDGYESQFQDELEFFSTWEVNFIISLRKSWRTASSKTNHNLWVFQYFLRLRDEPLNLNH